MKYSLTFTAAAAALSVTSVHARILPIQEPQIVLGDPEVSTPNLSSDLTNVNTKKPLVDSSSLEDTIKIDNLFERAKTLYEIAKRSEDQFNHPTRVIGSKGHAGTVEYVQEVLHGLGDYYKVWTQSFPAFFGKVFESRLVIDNEVLEDAVAMGLCPPTKNRQPVRAPLVLVANAGCNEEDYPKEAKGAITLISRGECIFSDKSKLSGKAGALAALVYDTEAGPLHGTLGDYDPDKVATFGLDRKTGLALKKRLENKEEIDVSAYVDAIIEKIQTPNVLAQTKGGDQDNCVMLGGHSDSVAEGPGINDDGSGSLSVLEVAVQLAKYDVNNCVRFAWWAAEEEGLLGSTYYVETLSEEENRKIRMFMDYDMMASPNFAYQIYNATNAANPEGSEELRQLYIDWYEKNDLPYKFIPFDGRSDYDAFIKNSIPGGGIATGAEVVKTKEEAREFGGKAGDSYDPCYHQLCDDLNNLNLTAWEVNTKLIAHSVATYARSLEGFPKRKLASDSDELMIKSNAYQPKYRGDRLIM